MELSVSESSLPFVLPQACDFMSSLSYPQPSTRTLCSEAAERTQPGEHKTPEISVSAVREDGEKDEGSTGRTSESLLLLPPPLAEGCGIWEQCRAPIPPHDFPISAALEEERCPLQPARPGSSLLCLSLGQVLFQVPSQNTIFRITQLNSCLI